MILLNVFGRVHERKVTRKDGTEFKIRFQEAEILRDGRRPRVIELSVRSNDHYKEGLYTLAANSVRPNKYDQLELAFPSLTPLGNLCTGSCARGE